MPSMDATLTQILQQLYMYSVEIDQLRARLTVLENEKQGRVDSLKNGTSVTTATVADSLPNLPALIE